MMKTNKTIQKILRTIKNNHLITDKSHVLVALSGGADSVFLLHVLHKLSKEMGFKLAACHVEHGIRGESSLADMSFSMKLCSDLGIECFAKSFDVPALSKSEKISLEAAGRKVRYGFFEEIMKANSFTTLATAHHKDDKTETIVMNILRGCGLRGFAGIEYKNGDVIRPLLDVSKEEILSCCSEMGISYCTDETNNQTDYTRNKIRLKLLPILREFNPSFDDGLQRQSCIFTDEDDYLNSQALDAFNRCKNQTGIDIAKLKSYHIAIQRRVLFQYLASCKGSELDITYKDVDAALVICRKGETGKSCNLGNGVDACVEYGTFHVKNQEQAGIYEYELEYDKEVEIAEAGIKITLRSSGGKLLINPGDKVVVRSRKDGDWFYPVGMTGKKKLKDYFQSKKISSMHRNSVPILTINGEIAAVIGMRNDRRFYDCGGSCHLETELI